MISGTTSWLGVMGMPVKHSLSPRLHNFWLAQHNIDAVYLPLPVPPEQLPAIIKALPHLGCRGVNVTIPHKEPLLKLLDGVDPLATQIGAVNTVVVQSDGKLWGTNTDAFGFAASVKAAGHALDAGSALVLGAGGAARAVLASLRHAGCRQIYLTNRSAARAETLVQHIGGNIQLIPWLEWPQYLPDVSLLINTTSCGLNGQDDFDLPLDDLPRDAAVCDLVYRPLMTGLLRSAAQADRQVIDGLGMLLYQAQESFRHWFGIAPPVDIDLRRFVLAGLA
jgi:shikimate dehydrogenase